MLLSMSPSTGEHQCFIVQSNRNESRQIEYNKRFFTFIHAADQSPLWEDPIISSVNSKMGRAL
jgi:hypothetical protein